MDLPFSYKFRDSLSLIDIDEFIQKNQNYLSELKKDRAAMSHSEETPLQESLKNPETYTKGKTSPLQIIRKQAINNPQNKVNKDVNMLEEFKRTAEKNKLTFKEDQETNSWTGNPQTIEAPQQIRNFEKRRLKLNKYLENSEEERTLEKMPGPKPMIGQNLEKAMDNGDTYIHNKKGTGNNINTLGSLQGQFSGNVPGFDQDSSNLNEEYYIERVDEQRQIAQQILRKYEENDEKQGAMSVLEEEETLSEPSVLSNKIRQDNPKIRGKRESRSSKKYEMMPNHKRKINQTDRIPSKFKKQAPAKQELKKIFKKKESKGSYLKEIEDFNGSEISLSESSGDDSDNDQNSNTPEPRFGENNEASESEISSSSNGLESIQAKIADLKRRILENKTKASEIPTGNSKRISGMRDEQSQNFIKKKGGNDRISEYKRLNVKETKSNGNKKVSKKKVKEYKKSSKKGKNKNISEEDERKRAKLERMRMLRDRRKNYNPRLRAKSGA